MDVAEERRLRRHHRFDEFRRQLLGSGFAKLPDESATEASPCRLATGARRASSKYLASIKGDCRPVLENLAHEREVLFGQRGRTS